MRNTRLDDYPDNLLREIFLEDINKPDDFSESLAYVLATLKANEQCVILGRFKDGYTLREEGDRLGVTQERVRQIETSAMRKIAKNKNILRYGVTGLIQKERDDALSLGGRVMQEQMKAALENHDRQIIRQIENQPSIVKRIAEVGFSRRASNALQRAGYNTVYDILQSSQSEISNLRSVGIKTVAEITKKLEELGYQWNSPREGEQNRNNSAKQEE